MSITLTIIGQAISFAIFVLFCMKFVWPPLINALRERQKTISDGLTAAAKAHDDLAAAQKTADTLVKEGKEQAATIVANANKRAATIVEEAKAQAEAEKTRIISSADDEIQRNLQKTRSELGGSLQALVVDGVRKIIGKEVDVSTHKSIIDGLESQIKQ